MKISVAGVLLALSATALAVGPNSKVLIPFADDDESGPRLCIAAPSNKDGAKVHLRDCTDVKATTGPKNTWTLTGGSAPDSNAKFTKGPLTQIRIYGDKCLDVTDGKNKAGTPLQIWTCDKKKANKNQLWNVNERFGMFNLKWANHTFCASITNKKNASAPIDLVKCDPDNSDSYSSGQVWRLFDA